jgi:hypothetical protein
VVAAVVVTVIVAVPVEAPNFRVTVVLPAAGAQLGRVAVVAPVGDEVKVQVIEMIPE